MVTGIFSVTTVTSCFLKSDALNSIKQTCGNKVRLSLMKKLDGLIKDNAIVKTDIDGLISGNIAAKCGGRCNPLCQWPSIKHRHLSISMVSAPKGPGTQ